MLFIGIDPGLSGAVAAINEKGNLIALQDTPVLLVKKGTGRKHIYVDAQMATLLEATLSSAAGQEVLVTLENVHAMPGQGVTSMFSLGVGVGIWRGIVAALRLPLAFVEPKVWKRSMGLIGTDKAQSIIRARQFFPRADLSQVKDHGRADALLIAEHTRRTSTDSHQKTKGII